jgi:DNA-binding beta-propeller fold protein YncE
VDVDHRGLVYVTDSRDRSLQIFTSDGSFVSEAPVEDEFGPLLPNDVAIHPDGSQAVVGAAEDVLVYALTN